MAFLPQNTVVMVGSTFHEPSACGLLSAFLYAPVRGGRLVGRGGGAEAARHQAGRQERQGPGGQSGVFLDRVVFLCPVSAQPLMRGMSGKTVLPFTGRLRRFMLPTVTVFSEASAGGMRKSHAAEGIQSGRRVQKICFGVRNGDGTFQNRGKVSLLNEII